MVIDPLCDICGDLEQHRSETYRSKLKASLMMKHTRLSAKQPLKHELKFMVRAMHVIR